MISVIFIINIWNEQYTQKSRLSFRMKLKELPPLESRIKLKGLNHQLRVQSMVIDYEEEVTLIYLQQIATNKSLVTETKRLTSEGWQVDET